MRDPLGRLFPNMPHGWRVALDWIFTIVGAIAVVLVIKAYVVNPYRIPSSSMEPTLHCARPGPGCEARFSDRVLANRFIYRFRDPKRGEIIVFKTPPLAKARCGAGGTFVKRRDRPARRRLERGERLRLHQRQEAERAVRQGRPPRLPVPQDERHPARAGSSGSRRAST